MHAPCDAVLGMHTCRMRTHGHAHMFLTPWLRFCFLPSAFPSLHPPHPPRRLPPPPPPPSLGLGHLARILDHTDPGLFLCVILMFCFGLDYLARILGHTVPGPFLCVVFMFCFGLDYLARILGHTVPGPSLCVLLMFCFFRLGIKHR